MSGNPDLQNNSPSHSVARFNNDSVTGVGDYKLEPHDTDLGISRRYLRAKDNTLTYLASEDLMNGWTDISNIGMYFQILRVICPDNEVALYSKMNSSNKNGKVPSRSLKLKSEYSRMFLCRRIKVGDSSESSNVAYIMMSRSENRHIWERDPTIRDNGTLTIGSIFRIYPLPIERFVNKEIPCIVSDGQAILIKDPLMLEDVKINSKGTTTKAFTLNGVELKIRRYTALDSNCGGLFCDKQRVQELQGTTKGCGCIATNHHRCPTAMIHWLAFKDQKGNVYQMPSFSSTRFMNLYTKNGHLPMQLKAHRLIDSELFESMTESMHNVVSYVNSKGMFTVCGWYKRGLITDKSLTQDIDDPDMNQFESGEVNYRVILVRPTNPVFQDPESIESKHLETIQFDVNRLGELY